MKIGDMLPAALWYNNDHPKEKANAKRGIEEALKMTAEDAGVTLGPINWDDVDPHSPMLKEAPPDGFQGDIRCMIGSAIVAGLVPRAVDFTDDLTPEDLHTLRTATRKKMGAPDLTDEECDDQINSYGPDLAADETLH